MMVWMKTVKMLTIGAGGRAYPAGSSQLVASGLLFGAVVLTTAYITAHAIYGKALD